MLKVSEYAIFANFSKLCRPVTQRIMSLKSSSFFHSIGNFSANKNDVQMLLAILSRS